MTGQTWKSLLIGAVAGSMAGLLGVGGGAIMVPLMGWLLAMKQHNAHATSLAVILVVGVFAATSYAVLGNIDWPLVAAIGAGGVAGAFIGARLMARVPARLLRRLFAVVLLAVAVRFLIGVQPDGMAAMTWVVGVMTWVVGVLIGLAAGVLGGLLGVGGGLVTIPGMVLLMNVDQHTAQGVSLVAIVFTAAMATTVHYRAGFVRVRTALLIAVPAALFSVAGAFAANTVSPSVLSRMLGGLLLVVGLRMAWK